MLSHEAIVRKLEEAFRWDCTVIEACAYAKIARSTYYRLMEEHPEFSDRMIAAQQWPYIAAKKILFAHMLEKQDAQLALKFLERRQREHYSVRMLVKPDLPFEVVMEKGRADGKRLSIENAALERFGDGSNHEPIEVQ